VLCAPVRSSHRFLGVVFASHRDPAFNFDRYQVQLLTAIGMQAGIALENLRLYRRLERSFLETVEVCVKAIDARDRYTAGHSNRVARMSVSIAHHLPLAAPDLRDLRLGALLHDIGKIGINDECLRAARRLTPEEYAHVQQHTVFGDQILHPLDGLATARIIARHHHERWDGRGYPDGLAGEAIPLLARIVAVADSVDAITSDRPYRPARSLDVAVNELLANRGTQFDPTVVRAFLDAHRADEVQVGEAGALAEDVRLTA
jgi:putative nucleotidyltransferase with HDIG domain